MSLKIGDRVVILNDESPNKNQIDKKAKIVNKYKDEDGFCLMFDEKIGHGNYKGSSPHNTYYKEENDHLFKKGNYYFWYFHECNVKKISQEIKVFEND